ncbi:MAG: hypothetical protein JWO06_2068 [Bacteroidota bacterium]|nr:hypothetical protein [Bacteroidota bacterium]
MKINFLLWVSFVLYSQASLAQLVYGDGVVTRCDYQGTDRVVKIFQLADTSGAPYGDNWGITPSPDYTDWNSHYLGQVFGVTVNTNDADQTIYVANTQAYPQTSAITYPNGLQNYPDPSPAGVVLIWALNPNTGSYTPLVTSTLNGGTLTTNDSTVIFNRGSGLGNISFDKLHNQIFATNMEDGRIYRIDAASGKVLSRYDPFNRFTYAATNIPKVVDLGERIWGIQFDNLTIAGIAAQKLNKVYFAQWNEDLGHQTGVNNQIYSVGINFYTGDFIAASGASQYDLIDTVPHLEIVVPPIPTNPANATPYSNPVSDIKISSNSNIMLLAEKTMSAEAGGANLAGSGSLVGQIAEFWAHRSRVMRYDLNNSTWTFNTHTYYVGNYSLVTSTGYTPVDYNNTNCSGGVDFGMSFQTKILTENDTCETMLWATGDALKHPSFPGGTHPSEFVYGIAGIALTNGNSHYKTAGNPASEDSSTIYQDVFSNSTGSYQGGKALPGDIYIYRHSCRVSLGTENTESIAMTCFPNPFNTELSVKYENFGNDNIVIELFDNLGKGLKRLENQGLGTHQVNLNLSDLSSGMYTVKITIGDKLKVAKVVKN